MAYCSTVIYFPVYCQCNLYTCKRQLLENTAVQINRVACRPCMYCSEALDFSIAHNHCLHGAYIIRHYYIAMKTGIAVNEWPWMTGEWS